MFDCIFDKLVKDHRRDQTIEGRGIGLNRTVQALFMPDFLKVQIGLDDREFFTQGNPFSLGQFQRSPQKIREGDESRLCLGRILGN
jgi:hypothetical protein